MVKEIEKINAVNELLTLNMLYQWLVYISSGTVWKLVYNGLVTSLKLEESRKTNIFVSHVLLVR